MLSSDVMYVMGGSLLRSMRLFLPRKALIRHTEPHDRVFPIEKKKVEAYSVKYWDRTNSLPNIA